MDFQQKVQVSLTVLLTGLVVVFLMLIFLTLIIKGYGMAVSSVQKKLKGKQRTKEASPDEAAHEPESAKTFTAVQVDETGLPEEIIAAVTAAAYCTYPNGVVTSVRRSRSTRQSRSAWNAAGLLENTRPF